MNSLQAYTRKINFDIINFILLETLFRTSLETSITVARSSGLNAFSEIIAVYSQTDVKHAQDDLWENS
jgi:hypothetical protein